MSSCLYTHNGVTMNQQQLFEAIMQEILNDAENKFGSIKDTLFKSVTQADTVATLESIQKQGKGKTYRAVPGKTTETGWIGVSEYMEQFHDLGKVSLSGDQINSLLFPIYNMNARIETMYKQERMLNPDESRPKEEIMELIRTQLADEKLGTRVGSIFHDIIAVILDKGKDSAEFQTQLERTKKLLNKTLTVEEKKELNVPDYITTLLQLMTSDVPGGLTEQQALDIFVDRASRLAGRIKAEHPGAKFYSEMDMCTDKAVAPNGTDGKPLSIRGLHGRSDLVIAEADGTTSVLDFKVATRHYDDWCAAKRYHTEYQLGFYRHILAANGIDGATTKLLISPIFMKRGDLTALELDGDGPDGALPKNVLTPTRYNASRLDWEFGQFTENIRKMVNIPFSVSAMESSELSGKINESFGEMVTYTPKDRFYGKQEFLDRWVNSEKRGGVDEWVFYDWSNHNKRVAFKDKEDFIKDGGFIDQFNDRIKKLTHSQVKEIIRQIEEARKEGTKHSDIDFLQSRGSNSSVAKHLSAAFGIYAGDQYQLVDAPILMEYGIIAYENTTTHTIYFEVLTDQHLQAIVDNNGQTTVLGNHYSNDEVRRLKGIDAMEAKCGNMELLKALHVINSLYQEHPESFANKKIGQIEVVNAAFGERHSVSMEQLVSNYSLLASKVGIKNNFSGGKIKTSDLWEAMIADVNKAIIDAEEDKDLKQILSTLKGTTVTKSERLKQIENCIKKMKARYTDLRFVDFKDKRTFDLDNPVHVAYLAMVETYDYLLGIPVTYNGEISKWGLHFGEVIKILTLPFIKD